MKRARPMIDMARGNVLSLVLSRKVIVGALVAAGTFSAGLGVEQLLRTPAEALVIAPGDLALCRMPGTGGQARSPNAKCLDDWVPDIGASVPSPSTDG